MKCHKPGDIVRLSKLTARAAKNAVERIQSCKTIDIRKSQISQEILDILTGAILNSSITTLVLTEVYFSTIQKEQLEFLFRKAENITTIYLNYVYHGTPVNSILKTVVNCQSLRVLWLFCNIVGKGLAQVIRNVSTLEHLILDNVESMSENVIDAITKSTRLKVLVLKNAIYPSARIVKNGKPMQYIPLVIAQNTSITKLELLQTVSSDARDIRQLGDALTKNKTLKTLVLGITNTSSIAIDYFLSCVQRNLTLRNLTFRPALIGHSQQLREIGLRNGKVQTSITRCITLVLWATSRYKGVFLPNRGWNSIGVIIARYLAASRSDHVWLRTLNPRNSILNFMTCKNKGLHEAPAPPKA